MEDGFLSRVEGKMWRVEGEMPRVPLIFKKDNIADILNVRSIMPVRTVPLFS